MNFCFTIDDNIRAFRESAERGGKSIFEHPYFAMLRRLHEAADLKVQLNMFYEADGFSCHIFFRGDVMMCPGREGDNI